LTASLQPCYNQTYMSNPNSPRIIFANANIADPMFGPLRLFRPASVGEFAARRGYDGVEWTPIFDLTCASPRAIVRAARNQQLNLNSLHAAARSHVWSRNNPSEQRRGLQDVAMTLPIGRLVMPRVTNSSKFIQKVRTGLNTPAPAVLYPQQNQRLDARAIRLAGDGPILMQPTDDIARIIGARTVEEFVEKTIENGPWDGFVLDTVHAQRRYGADEPGVISNLGKSLPVLAPYIQAGHFGINRLDVIGNEPDLASTTRQDLRNALNGRYTGGTADVLAAVRESDASYVVVESTAGAMAETLDEHSTRGLAEQYATIAAGLRVYMEASPPSAA
jgi:hypothetical protein